MFYQAQCSLAHPSIPVALKRKRNLISVAAVGITLCRRWMERVLFPPKSSRRQRKVRGRGKEDGINAHGKGFQCSIAGLRIKYSHKEQGASSNILVPYTSRRVRQRTLSMRRFSFSCQQKVQISKCLQRFFMQPGAYSYTLNSS